MNQRKRILLPFLLSLCLALASCSAPKSEPDSYTRNTIPAYAGEPYVVLHDNQPDFGDVSTMTVSFESYSELDALGRCGVAYACLSTDTMPTEERGSIGQVKPSGWQTVRYDFVSGQYLYNRCHLIGYQLSGENANAHNLITGTRYLNTEGMLPFEDMVADFIKETGYHVLYRATPVFEGNHLLASGVQIEAQSVEDNGAGICFNVYCYNVQPGVVIDYATGQSYAEGQTPPPASTPEPAPAATGSSILNTSNFKFHLPACSSAQTMKGENKQTYTGSRDALIEQGYTPCGRCKP